MTRVSVCISTGSFQFLNWPKKVDQPDEHSNLPIRVLVASVNAEQVIKTIELRIELNMYYSISHLRAEKSCQFTLINSADT